MITPDTIRWFVLAIIAAILLGITFAVVAPCVLASRIDAAQEEGEAQR